MDARTIRTLMDIQAMQTLGSVQTYANGAKFNFFPVQNYDK